MKVYALAVAGVQVIPVTAGPMGQGAGVSARLCGGPPGAILGHSSPPEVVGEGSAMAAPRGSNRCKSAVLGALIGGWALLDTAAGAAQTTMDQAARHELEELLHVLGFSPGTVDGFIDDDTRAAIGRYHEFAFITAEAAEATTVLLTELRGVALQVRELRESSSSVLPAQPDLADYGTLEPPVEPSEEAAAIAAGEDETPLVTSAGAEAGQNVPPEVATPAAAQSAAVPPQPEAEVEPEAETGLSSEPLSADSQAFIEEGVAALEAGQADRAIAMLTAALGLQPDQMAAYELRAAALVAKGNFNSAVGDFDQVVRLAPESPAAYSNRCWVLGQAGRYAEALRDCDVALSMAPDFAAAFHIRAQVLEMMGRDEEARDDYARAYALAPDNSEIAQDAGRFGLAD